MRLLVGTEFDVEIDSLAALTPMHCLYRGFTDENLENDGI